MYIGILDKEKQSMDDDGQINQPQPTPIKALTP